jgi:hypothetical protein
VQDIDIIRFEMEDPMRFFVMLAAVLISFSAVPVQAQPSCPEDVGALLASECPCGADKQGASWKNHGQYVKCVVHLRNQLRKDGCLDANAKRTIASCAARSTCGKEGAVLCCVYDTSATCSDLVPNGVQEGVCSSDGTTPCDTATDCITVVSGPKVSRHADRCTDRGGTPVGGGSVCGDCPLPPPAP